MSDEAIVENETLLTINPSTGEELQQYDKMTNQQMDSAIKACHEAFLKWKIRPAKERAEIISMIGEHLQKNWPIGYVNVEK